MSILVPETEAPARFAEILDFVMAGEEVVITRGGNSIAVVSAGGAIQPAEESASDVPLSDMDSRLKIIEETHALRDRLNLKMSAEEICDAVREGRR